MGEYVPARLVPIVSMLDLLAEGGRHMAKEAAKRATGLTRRGAKRNATLRPGIDTPHWNALVAMVRPNLRRRGARALLAKELAVHRARIGEFIDAGSSMPDAERTIKLLLWVLRQQSAETPDEG